MANDLGSGDEEDRGARAVPTGRVGGSAGRAPADEIGPHGGSYKDWLSAVKSTYFRKLPTDQKVRMAARVGVRSMELHREND